MSGRLVGLLSYLGLPYVAFKAVSDREFRRSLPERRGANNLANADLPPGRTVWLHGASVGEVGGLIPVLNGLKSERPDLRFLITTTSLTGKAEVNRRAPDAATALLPLDLPGIVRRMIAQVEPAIVIVAETELWPNFLEELRRKSIPVLLINGRISDFTYPTYSRFRFLFRPLLEVFSRILVQTQVDAERFVALGAPREKVLVCGSTKYSAAAPPVLTDAEREAIGASLGIDASRPCFVAGSVRPGEEETIVDAYREVRAQYPDLQCIIAPRHMDRVEPLCKLLEEAELEYVKKTELELQSQMARANRVMVLDTHGELRRAYALATMAFVGGSLVDIGGHNPLEPAAFGVPVLFGPSDKNVRDAVWQLKQAGGLIPVASEEDVIQALRRLLHSPQLRDDVGRAARKVAEQNSRTVETVLPIVQSFLPPDDVRAVGNQRR